MLNHITLCVSDRERSKAFYATTLKPLGYELYVDEQIVGFGTKDSDGWRDLWLKKVPVLPSTPSFSCLSFTAQNKQAVDQFHRAALKAGGKDNGAPGYRKQYSTGYYAAFVLDPDGYNIEAVFDDPHPTS